MIRKLVFVAGPALGLALATGVATLATVSDARLNSAEAALVCPADRITGTGASVFRERSKKKARENWQRAARRKYGTSRISWWNGRDRAYSCRRGKHRVLYCFAFARPCF